MKKGLMALITGIFLIASTMAIPSYTSSDEILRRISKEVKKVAREIDYEEDLGKDQWSPPEVTRAVGFGDCDDFAILLRDGLRKKGINTKFNVGWIKPNRKGPHAWLEYTSPTGKEYVLESTNGKIYSREETRRKGYYNIYASEDDWRGKFSRQRNELNSAAGRKIL